MAILADTSILVRLANTTDAQHAIAARAILELHRRGVRTVFSPLQRAFREAVSGPSFTAGENAVAIGLSPLPGGFSV